MKICIPVVEDNDIQSKLSGHFGSAPYFLVYDDSSEDVRVVDNSNDHEAHGQCMPVNLLKDMQVDIVVCNGMGLRALENLKNMDIRVFRPLEQYLTAEEIIAAAAEGKLQELAPQDACSHHHH